MPPGTSGIHPAVHGQPPIRSIPPSSRPGIQPGRGIPSIRPADSQPGVLRRGFGGPLARGRAAGSGETTGTTGEIFYHLFSMEPP